MHNEGIKEVVAWAMNKYFKFSYKNVLKTVVPLSYQRIRIVYIAMWSM